MRTLPLFAAALAGLALGAIGSFAWMHRAGDRAPPSTPPATAPGKSVLYWYDPMVPGQHFDQPGTSPFMDMPLVAKYAGDESADAPGTVRIDPRQVQNLGVRTAKVSRGALAVRVRVPGSIAFDERAVEVVQARVSGIVEHLDVRAPLATVKRGQTLMTLLAPEWTAAQEEYLALRRSGARGLDDLRRAARQRLALLGMSEAQIRAVEQRGQAQTRIAVTAPRDGVVAELSARDGATVVAGSPLARIVGLDDMWINAAVPESQIGRVSARSSVRIEVSAFPGRRLPARIESFLPDVDATTRTQAVRIVVDNRDHRLAPGMYAQVEFSGESGATEVLAPSEAVIATGTRSVIIVADGDGRFRAREVRVGHEADGRTEILEGLEGDENVVLSGQFLIDSEASLAGTLARLGDGGTTKPAAKAGDGEGEDIIGEGTVRRIEGDQWSIAADAIPSLGMGAMTMTFIRSRHVPTEARPGQRIRFAFRRDAHGDLELRSVAPIGERAEGNAPDGGPR